MISFNINFQIGNRERFVVVTFLNSSDSFEHRKTFCRIGNIRKVIE